MSNSGGLRDLQDIKNIIIHLDEEDLLMLDRLIGDRIKLVRAEKIVQSMAGFEVGDSVFFHNKQDERVDATVLRLNKKTLSLITDDGERCNVAPELCQFDIPVTGDLFEQENLHDRSNVTVLPTAAATRSAGQSASQAESQTEAKGRWYGGIVEMPAYVTEEGEPYRPLVMMWLDAEGMIAATEVCSPQSDLNQVALKTLQQAMHSPMTGRPQRPKYITVNDRDLAAFLTLQETGINIEYGDTPLLDDLVNNFGDMMPPGDAPDGYLSTGLSAEQIAGFFKSATALYHSAPWKRVPNDSCLLSVTIESLGLYDAVLLVIGQMGESFGIIVYENFQQYSQYCMAVDRMNHGLDIDIPPHTALSFDEGAEVSTAIRKEIAEHGWQVANTSSYPVVFTPDRGNLVRPMVAADIVLFDALSRVLPTILNSHSQLMQAWNGERGFLKNITVEGIGDRIDVEISAPYPFEKGYASKVPGDITMIQLALFAHAADEPDADDFQELCCQLQDRFFDSPEGQKCPDRSSIVTPLTDIAFRFHGSTMATLQAGQLEQIIFEIIPRKVLVPPEHARAIIEECRLFYRFLKRQYGLPQADYCLEVLGGNAISRFKAALADGGGSSPGKGMLASGMLAAIDKGIVAPGNPFEHIDMSGPPQQSSTKKPVGKQDKKSKRKSTKKARKKNR